MPRRTKPYSDPMAVDEFSAQPVRIAKHEHCGDRQPQAELGNGVASIGKLDLIRTNRLIVSITIPVTLAIM